MKKIFFSITTFCCLIAQCNSYAGNPNNNNLVKKMNVSAIRSNYTPMNKFQNYHKYDCGEIRKDGVVGRHAFFKPYSVVDKGDMPCARYSKFVEPNAFKEVTISLEYYETSTIFMSFTHEIAYQAANEMNIIAEIPGFVKATNKYEFVVTNEYKEVKTSSYSVSEATKETYTVSEEAGNGQDKQFAIGKVAHVYEIKAQYYETHWLYWDHEKVLEDTVKDFIAYVAVDAYLDVIYKDGTFFKNK